MALSDVNCKRCSIFIVTQFRTKYCKEVSMSIKSKTLFDKIRRNNPYFEDFITRSVYHSNAIEGNTLSYAETYSLIFNKNDMKITAQPRDLYEAINLKYAMNYILSNLDRDLSLDMIKQIGICINRNINDIDDFRKTQVFINGAEYIPPKPYDVRRLLSELVYENKKERTEDIFIYLARFHITFERIHPFTDGNGRTGRILITKELLSRGVAPIVAPIVVPLDYRSQYMTLLANTNVIGLASMFKVLSNIELERMTQFGIKI